MRLKILSAGVLALLCGGLISGCNFDDVSVPDGTGTLSNFSAICELSNEAGPIVCEDIVSNTPANQTGCTTTEKSQYSTEGAVGASYLAPTGQNVFVSCSQTITNTTVGSCQLSDRVLIYYSGPFSTTTAQADCSSRAGQWL